MVKKGPSGAASVFVALETTRGDIVVRLEPARAPVTVANFLGYLDAGGYDGTIFHRVVPGFVIQGGGYDAGFGLLPEGEPIVNEWPTGMSNTRGTIAMARETDPDTATRQFYINVSDNGRLDTARDITGNAGYAVFGRVVDGMQVVDLIRDGEREDREDLDLKNVPVEPVVVTRARRLRPEESARY